MQIELFMSAGLITLKLIVVTCMLGLLVCATKFHLFLTTHFMEPFSDVAIIKRSVLDT